MTNIFICTVGVLSATGIFLILQRSLLSAFMGLILLFQGGFLFLLCLSGDPLLQHTPIFHEHINSYLDPFPFFIILLSGILSLGFFMIYLFVLYRSYRQLPTQVPAGEPTHD